MLPSAYRLRRPHPQTRGQCYLEGPSTKLQSWDAEGNTNKLSFYIYGKLMVSLSDIISYYIIHYLVG